MVSAGKKNEAARPSHDRLVKSLCFTNLEAALVPVKINPCNGWKFRGRVQVTLSAESQGSAGRRVVSGSPAYRRGPSRGAAACYSQMREHLVGQRSPARQAAERRHGAPMPPLRGSIRGGGYAYQMLTHLAIACRRSAAERPPESAHALGSANSSLF